MDTLMLKVTVVPVLELCPVTCSLHCAHILTTSSIPEVCFEGGHGLLEVAVIK